MTQMPRLRAFSSKWDELNVTFYPLQWIGITPRKALKGRLSVLHAASVRLHSNTEKTSPEVRSLTKETFDPSQW